MSSLNNIQNKLAHLDISGLNINNDTEKKNIHWHFIDISQNYFNDKINWGKKGIILNDDKYFTLYNIENLPYIDLPMTNLKDILEHNNSKNLTVKNVINYFNDIYIHTFKSAVISFLKWDKNPEKFASKINKLNNIGVSNNGMSDKDNHKEEPFIIVPTGKINFNGKNIVSFAIINVSKKMMKYISLSSNYKNSEHYKFRLMLNLLSGLTNHFNINGVITSTSFNIYKAFLKHYQTKKCEDMFKFQFNLENDYFEKDVPLCLVLNHMNSYFPKLQVIWSSYRHKYCKLEKIIKEGEVNKYKGHDVLFKYNQDFTEDNERQKRRAIKFHPYTRNKHIKDESELINEKSNKLKGFKSKGNKVNGDTNILLNKIGISDLSICDSF